MDSAELKELQHYFDVIQAASSIVTLEYCQHVIQASIRKYADREKSERDPVIDKLFREAWQILERRVLARISVYHVDSEIAQLEEELSSPAIDSAPPVAFIERIRSFPNPEYPAPPSISPRQYLEGRREAAEVQKTVHESEILECEHEFAELMKFLESNEIPKKPATESVQMDNRVSTSTASRKKKPKVKRPESGSSPVNNLGIEPEPVIEAVQPLGPVEEQVATQSQLQTKPPVPTPLELVNAYKAEVLEKTGVNIKGTDIWKKMGYKTRSAFERWVRQDPKRPNDTADQAFRRLLTETKPHLK